MNDLRNIATGIAVLTDWLGDGGKPVPQELAERRAAVCAGCEFNGAPRWWEQSKSVIARAMVRHLEAKHTMKLATPLDDKLHLCVKCGCCLPAKVWCPIEHIARHADLEKLNDYPSFCWQRREILDDG